MFYKCLLNLLLLISLLSCIELFAQESDKFEQKFPVEAIDQEIIERRNLGEKIKMLTDNCNWQDRIGEKIDVFWLRTDKGNLFGHVYEYILDCDNLRFIYWMRDPGGNGKVLDFMIENCEEDSKFVVRRKKQLKNRKKYRKYF